MSNSFASLFGHEPQSVSTAHGRVNLIGEHTDYCDGFVMPTLISQRITTHMRLRDDTIIHGISSDFGTKICDITEITTDSWLMFVKGAIAMMNEKGAAITGLDILTESSIPAGAGVSSSAAFEIALLRGLSDITNITITADEMARLGRRIEHEFIGLNCGIMDQMAVAMADIAHCLFLDCRTLETEVIAIPETVALSVIHSGSNRKLSSSLYNERLSETIKAASAMNIESLRDANLADIADIKEDVLARRAHHVISENARVLEAKEALRSQDVAHLGALMTQSHISLRDDYEVSSDALDQLVMSAISQGAYGARLTGAGFGGCIVALLPEESADEINEAILASCEGAWLVDCQ